MTAHHLRLEVLPGARFAVGEHDYREIVSRHLGIVRDLCALTESDPDDLRVITDRPSRRHSPKPRRVTMATAFPAGTFWRASVFDDDAARNLYCHWYVGRCELSEADLSDALRVISDDDDLYRDEQLLITTADARWLYAPFPGGADVFVPDLPMLDWLSDKHLRLLPDCRTRSFDDLARALGVSVEPPPPPAPASADLREGVRLWHFPLLPRRGKPTRRRPRDNEG